MTGFQLPNWESLFAPDLSLLESFARGSVVYLAILVLFRVVLKRQGGSIGIPDVLLVVLVSECVSASLSADSKSVPNGLVAVLALLFWNYVIDFLAYRWPWFQRLLEPQPLQLVRDGKPIRENMDRERITEDELQAQFRKNGVADVADVKAAYMESEGDVSVICRTGATGAHPPEPLLPSGEKPPISAPDLASVTERFLAATEELRAAVAWHETQVGKHRTAAKSARELLARHGVRAHRAVAPVPSTDGQEIAHHEEEEVSPDSDAALNGVART